MQPNSGPRAPQHAAAGGRVLPAVLAAGLVLLLAVASALGVGRWYAAAAATDLARRAETAAALRGAMLRSELEKQRSLPLVLAQDDELREALARPDVAHLPGLNRKLETLSAETRAAALYVVDRGGTTIASSNWREPTSFVGANYGFRPYFRDALARGYAEMFALGTVSNTPGLYLARRVDAAGSGETGGDGAGVVVVKVRFDALESEWALADEHAFVTDERGVVVITSVPQWRFRTLGRLAAGEVERLRAGLQYGRDASLAPLPLAFGDDGSVRADGREFAAARVPAAATGWTLHVLAPADRAVATARSSGRLVGGSVAALAGAGLLLLSGASARARERGRQREAARRELETRVAERTRELEDANARLVHEMDERRRAEANLHDLQDELVQANKLAVLGQVAAGVAHEINQPVAAIRSYVDNTEALLARGEVPVVRQNLAAIAGLTERIGLITSELRAFARKSTGAPTGVALAEVLDGAELLLASRLRSAGVRLRRRGDDARVHVLADRVRLEQVVVNLLQNALDALAGAAAPAVTLTVEVAGDQVRLLVADNGPGLPRDVADALFQPFVTTKPQGLGLGLVISREIVGESGGTLELLESGPGGATFVVTLPRTRA